VTGAVSLLPALVSSASASALQSTWDFVVAIPATSDWSGPVVLHAFSADIAGGGGALIASVALELNSTVDSTSSWTCADEYIHSESSTVCTLRPRLAGASVYARLDQFALSSVQTDPPSGVAIGAFSSCTPVPVAPLGAGATSLRFGAQFSCVFTAGYATGLYELRTGVSAPFVLGVFGTPDGTSSISICAGAQVVV
jgi:hypothetical protein